MANLKDLIVQGSSRFISDVTANDVTVEGDLTIEGTTTLSGDPTTDNEAATKHYVDTTHQSIKTLKTDNTTAQSTSASEAIAGSGTINLHKVAKTGAYSDLNGTPTIPTVNNAKLSIQGGGTTATEFTANASTDVTLNIKGGGSTSVTKTANNEITVSTTVPSPADTAPLMDGTAAVGTSTDYAREDHVHPSDTTKADSAQVFIPNFDEMTPVKTIEFDASATSWYKLFSRPNVGVDLTQLNDVVMFRVICTGTDIYSRHDFVVKFRCTLSPYVIYMSDTLSTTAATTGTYYVRFPYPKALDNGYDWICDLRAYNATARHYKIEVYATTDNITWVTGQTASTFNSTYQTTFECLCYDRRGFSHPNIPYVNISGSSTTASYVTSYHPKYINAICMRAGQSLATYNIVYVSDDGYAFKISNKLHEIDPDYGISAIGSLYSTNMNIGYAHFRIQSNVAFTSDADLTYDNMLMGNNAYLRCRLIGDKIYSDGHITNKMTPGYTWYLLGCMYGTVSLSMNTSGSMFITLDDNGMISHINGKAVNSSLLNGTYENLIQNKITSSADATGKIESVKGSSVVFNQIVPAITNSTAGWKLYTSGTVLSAADGVISAYNSTGAASFGVLSDTGTINVVKDHLYYFSLMAKASKNINKVYYPYLGTGVCTPYQKYADPQPLGTEWTKIDGIFYGKAAGNPSIGIRNYTTAVGEATLYMKDVMIIDLTKLVGDGNTIQSTKIYRQMFPLSFYNQNISGTLLHGIQSGFISKDSNNVTLTNLNIPIRTLTGTPVGGSVSEIMFPYGINSIGNTFDEIFFKLHTATKRIWCVDLGSLTWTKTTSNTNASFYADLTIAAKKPSDWTSKCEVLCQPYMNGSANDACGSTSGVKDVIGIRPDNGKVAVCPSATYTDGAAFKTAMDGVYLLYVMQTPVEYTLDDDLTLEYTTKRNGTEEWLPENTATPAVAPISSISSYMSSLSTSLDWGTWS